MIPIDCDEDDENTRRAGSDSTSLLDFDDLKPAAASARVKASLVSERERESFILHVLQQIATLSASICSSADTTTAI